MTTYLTGLVGLVGLLMAGMGWAEFDPATGAIDIAPFNAYALVAAIPTVIGMVIAPVALALGWGKK